MKGSHHHHWKGRGRGNRAHISSKLLSQPESFRDGVSSTSGQESDSEPSPGRGPGRRYRHRRVSPTPDSEYPELPNPYPYPDNNSRTFSSPSEDSESLDVPPAKRNRHNFRKTVRRVHEKGGYSTSREAYRDPNSDPGFGPPEYDDEEEYQYPERPYQNPGQDQNPGPPMPIYPQQHQLPPMGFVPSQGQGQPYYPGQGQGRGTYYPQPPQQPGQPIQQGRGPAYVPPPPGLGFGRQGYGQEIAAQQGQRQGCMKGRNKIALICLGIIGALFILSTIGGLIGKFTGANSTTTARPRRDYNLTTTSTTKKRTRRTFPPFLE